MQRGDQDCRRLAQGCGDLSGVVVGGGGQVAQRDVGRWFGRAGGDDLVRPAQAVGAVEVTGQQRCLRGDLGAVPIETQGRHAAGTSPSQMWKVSNLLTRPAVKVNTSE